MNKKRIVGVALAVGACGVLAAAGMMLSKKSGAVVLDQAGNEIAKLILQDGKISYECEDKISVLCGYRFAGSGQNDSRARRCE